MKKKKEQAKRLNNERKIHKWRCKKSAQNEALRFLLVLWVLCFLHKINSMCERGWQRDVIGSNLSRARESSPCGPAQVNITFTRSNFTQRKKTSLATQLSHKYDSTVVFDALNIFFFFAVNLLSRLKKWIFFGLLESFFGAALLAGFSIWTIMDYIFSLSLNQRTKECGDYA